MVAWDQAKGKQKNDKDRRDIKRLALPLGETKIRLVGQVLPRYVYWITTKEGRKMPVECLQYIREKEAFDSSAQDPMKELDEDVYDEKAQFAYVCNVFDRNDNNEIKLLDLRATIYQQIVDYAVNADYGNPADPETGYDLTIKKESTGPKPQNVKYTIIPARNNVALTAEEQAAELFDLDAIFKRQNYDDQKKWLLDNTTYFAGDVSDEFVPSESASDLA